MRSCIAAGRSRGVLTSDFLVGDFVIALYSARAVLASLQCFLDGSIAVLLGFGLVAVRGLRRYRCNRLARFGLLYLLVSSRDRWILHLGDVVTQPLLP